MRTATAADIATPLSVTVRPLTALRMSCANLSDAVSMRAAAFSHAPVRAARPVPRGAVRAQAAADELTLKIKLKAYEVPVLEEASELIRQAVVDTGASPTGVVRLPTRRRIYCVLRSPHVHSNSREHFEIRTHQRLIHVKDVTREAVQSLMNISLPAGVDCKVRL